MKNNYHYKVFFVVLILTIQSMLFTKIAQAAIFKCVSKDGATFYNDKPCPKNNEETKLNAVKDPTNGYIPPEFSIEEDTSTSKGVVIGDNKERMLDNQEKDTTESDAQKTASSGSNANNLNKTESAKEKINIQSQATNLKSNETSSASVNSISKIDVVEVEPFQ